MRIRIHRPHPLRNAVICAVQDPNVPLSRLWRAFWSLPDEDRDCLPYVRRLLALEG